MIVFGDPWWGHVGAILGSTLKQQMSDHNKQKLADIIIKTDRGKRYLLNNVVTIIKLIKNKKVRKINDILKEF